MKRSAFVSTALALLLSGRAGAGQIVLNALDSGWYQGSGGHSSSNDNYIVGKYGNQEYRNWFAFDLRGVPNNAVSAELRLFNPGGGYKSADIAELLILRGVETPAGALRSSHATGNPEGQAIFADLGSGPVYGYRLLTQRMNGRDVRIPLTDAALAAINASDSVLALGGHLLTVGGSGDQYFAGGSGGINGRRQLVLTFEGPVSQVPEPGSLALLAVGAAGLTGYAGRRRAAGREPPGRP